MELKNALVALLPLVIVAISALAFYSFSTDEYAYMNAARSFASGNYFGLDDLTRFPLFSFFLSAPFALFGPSELASRLLPLACGLLTVLLVFELGEKILGKQKAFWAAAMLASVPFFSFLSTRVLSETLFSLLFVCCIYLSYECFVQGKLKRAWMLGAFLALLFLARYNGLILALAIPLYLWRSGKLNLLFSRHALFAAIAFVVTLSPWMYYSYLATGSPVGLAYDFVRQQVHVGQKLYMSLPDRIPTMGGLASIPGSTLLATAAILGCGSLLMACAVLAPGRRKKLREFGYNNAGFLLFSSALVVGVAGELIGVLHPSLVRYVVPAAPFLALLLASQFDAKNAWLGKKAFAAAIILNVIVGLLLVGVFTPILPSVLPFKVVSYEKQALHRQVGLLSQGCSSIASNLKDVTFFYTGLKSVPIELRPQCIALSDFEGGYIGEVPAGYETVFNNTGVRLYKRSE